MHTHIVSQLYINNDNDGDDHKIKSGYYKNAQTRPKSKRVGGFEWEEHVWEVKRQFMSRENERNENRFYTEAI